MTSVSAPILIVDDNAETRAVLAQMLALRGYDTVAASGAKAALRYFRQGGRACLVILDMMMPDMSGAELRAELLRDPDTASIPVVVYSAVDDAGRVSEVEAYVRKAMDPDDLLRVVDRACGRRS